MVSFAASLLGREDVVGVVGNATEDPRLARSAVALLTRVRRIRHDIADHLQDASLGWDDELRPGGRSVTVKVVRSRDSAGWSRAGVEPAANRSVCNARGGTAQAQASATAFNKPSGPQQR